MNIAIYFVCRFSGTCSVYDIIGSSSQTILPSQVETIRSLFPAVIKDGVVLDAFAVTLVTGRKLPKGSPATYIIFRIDQLWVIRDSLKGISTVVPTKDAIAIQELFPRACTEDLIYDTATILPISASKLQSLTSSKTLKTERKLAA